MEYLDIVNLLVQFNADPSIVDKTNQRPQDMTSNLDIKKALE